MSFIPRHVYRLKNINLKNGDRLLSTTNQVNSRVTLLGANKPCGAMLSLLLKQNPYITSLKLYDDHKDLKGMALDLSHIDTSCKIKCYTGKDNLKLAMTSTDILIINNVDIENKTSDMTNFTTISKKIDDIVIEMHHIDNIPITVVMSDPVEILTPIFGRFMYLEKFLDEKKLMGIPTPYTVIGNLLLSKRLKNMPETNNLLLYGGLVPESIYFWMEKYFPEQTIDTCEALFRSVENDLVEFFKNTKLEDLNNLKAYSAHRFISNLAESFLKKRMVVESCYVYHEGTFMTYPCVLGREGVEQIILKQEIETPKFFNSIKKHIEYIGDYDNYTRMLTAIPKSRDDPY